MGRPSLSVIYVNYESLTHLKRSLDSLLPQAEATGSEVIVVDNASRENVLPALGRSYPTVRAMRRSRNGGFAVGANEGARLATGAALLFLNPDTQVEPDALRCLLTALHSEENIGIVGPKLVNPDGTLQLSCRSFPTLWTGLFNRYSLLTRLLPGNRFSRSYLLSGWQHDTAKDVDWLSGAALLIRRDVFDAAGGWDEGYFFAIEDVDLCQKVHKLGKRVVYEPGAVVEHRIGGSSSRIPLRIIIARHRGMWRYYRRYLRGGSMHQLAVAVGIGGRALMQLAMVSAGRAGRAMVGRRPGPPLRPGAETPPAAG